MQSGTTSVAAACGNLQWSATTQDDGGGSERHDVSLPAAKAATITSSVLTFGSAHGFAGTEVLCIFGAFGRRYGVTISAHDTLTVTVTGGSGDALPTGGTAVIVSVTTDVADATFDGDNLVYLLAVCDQIACIDFRDVGAASVGHIDVNLPGNGYGYTWSYVSGTARPITGNAVVTCKCYNKSTTAATLSFAVVKST